MRRLLDHLSVDGGALFPLAVYPTVQDLFNLYVLAVDNVAGSWWTVLGCFPDYLLFREPPAEGSFR